MDTRVGEIIVQAFHEGRLLPESKDTEAAQELVEAIPRLSSLLFSLVGLELGEKYADWPVPQTDQQMGELRRSGFMQEAFSSGVAWQYPSANRRLVASNSTPITVYFPSSPRDGARMSYVDVGSAEFITISGNGMLVQGQASITGRGGQRRWFFRADQGNWVCLKQFTSKDDVSPLPPEFDDLLICGLVLRLSPRFGKTPHEAIAGRYADMLQRLKKRYTQSEGVYQSDLNVFPATIGLL